MECIYSLCLITALVSFLGFVVENIWLGFTKGYIDNRNMIFPFLFGYGLAVVSIYLAFGTPREASVFSIDINISDTRLEILLYFIIVMLCLSLGEIILGKSVEKVCHIKWWDYSRLPLHITQYTSVFTSGGFSLMIVLFMDKIFVPLFNWNMTWNPIVLAVTAITLMFIMTVDFIHSAYLMYTKKSFVQIWRIDVSGSRIYKRICLMHQGKE